MVSSIYNDNMHHKPFSKVNWKRIKIFSYRKAGISWIKMIWVEKLILRSQEWSGRRKQSLHLLPYSLPAQYHLCHSGSIIENIGDVLCLVSFTLTEKENGDKEKLDRSDPAD